MRISYNRKHRKIAKAKKKGLFTVSLTSAEGTTVSIQGIVGREESETELKRAVNVALTANDQDDINAK